MFVVLKIDLLVPKMTLEWIFGLSRDSGFHSFSAVSSHSAKAPVNFFARCLAL